MVLVGNGYNAHATMKNRPLFHWIDSERVHLHVLELEKKDYLITKYVRLIDEKTRE